MPNYATLLGTSKSSRKIGCVSRLTKSNAPVRNALALSYV